MNEYRQNFAKEQTDEGQGFQKIQLRINTVFKYCQYKK